MPRRRSWARCSTSIRASRAEVRLPAASWLKKAASRRARLARRPGKLTSGRSVLDSAAAEAFRWASDRFPLTKLPRLEWRRYPVTAGTANYREWSISLSLIVLQDPQQVKTTLLHEYAHLLAVDRAGLKAANHGPEWRTAMQDLGLEPIVRHQYEVHRSRKLAVYRCRKCAAVFERRRRLPRGRLWIHRGCGGELEFVETVHRPSALED